MKRSAEMNQKFYDDGKSDYDVVVLEYLLLKLVNVITFKKLVSVNKRLHKLREKLDQQKKLRHMDKILY